MILESIATIGAKKVIEQVAEELYSYLKQHCAKAIKKWRAQAGVSAMFHQVAAVRMVKTLWQVDRPVDIAEFYCYPHVKLGDRSNLRIKINDAADLHDKHSILIQGIAGQGKSVLLRYLCAREMQRGKCIPVFIELRRLSDSKGIINHISEWLEVLGLEIDEYVLKSLGSSGKLMFFLDGFDEVRSDLQEAVISDIERLIMLCPSCRFIVSSRPDSGIESSSLLEVVKLDDLRLDEFKDVVCKLAASPEDAEILIHQVEEHGQAIRGLLVTPLFVTLLVITYKSFQELPAAMSDFYDALFQVLLKRHDGTKPGFRRQRNCNLNDKQYRDVFDAFCYESKREKGGAYKHATVYGIAEKAARRVRVKVDPESFVDDIVNVTCLLVRDGIEYRFIHKSVQEYYAASFLANRPEVVLSKFYDALIVRRRRFVGRKWEQELRFLGEIDTFRYVKMYRLPLIRMLLGLREGDSLELPEVNLDFAARLLSDMTVTNMGRGDGNRPHSRFFWESWIPSDLVPLRDFQEFEADLRQWIERPGVKMEVGLWVHKVKCSDDTGNNLMKKFVLDLTSIFARRLMEEARRLDAWLMEEQREDLTDGFVDL